MRSKKPNRGFTLIELMVTLAVVAILATIAGPNLRGFIDKSRLVGAAEAVYAQVQSARSEAVKQSASMRLVISGNANWCSGFRRDTGAACDCNAALGNANACSVLDDGQNAVLKVVRAASFDGITVAAAPVPPAEILFNGIRGTTGGDGAVRLSSPMGRQLQIEVNALGRARLCSPAGASAVGGYPAC